MSFDGRAVAIAKSVQPRNCPNGSSCSFHVLPKTPDGTGTKRWVGNVPCAKTVGSWKFKRSEKSSDENLMLDRFRSVICVLDSYQGRFQIHIILKYVTQRFGRIPVPHTEKITKTWWTNGSMTQLTPKKRCHFFDPSSRKRTSTKRTKCLAHTGRPKVESLSQKSRIVLGITSENGRKNMDPYIYISKNRGGPPKSSILIGFSSINHPFWGTPIFGNTHIWSKGIATCPVPKVPRGFPTVSS